MKLTRAGEYAVRCALYLSRSGKGVLVSRQEIAEKADIPSHFLAKIAQQLAREGIIEIRQGSKGGYLLLVEPEKLTLLGVVEAIIGEIFLNQCLSNPESCGASMSCSVNKVWKTASDQLRQTLREVTFASLINDEACCIQLLPGEIVNRIDE